MKDEFKCPCCGEVIPDDVLASYLGKKRGSATSEAKANSARENGKKGGRPRKDGGSK